MVVFLPGQGGITSGTVTPTEIPHVCDNRNIMRVRASLKARVESPANTTPMCHQGREYNSGAKGGVTLTENLEG